MRVRNHVFEKPKKYIVFLSILLVLYIFNFQCISVVCKYYLFKDMLNYGQTICVHMYLM